MDIHAPPPGGEGGKLYIHHSTVASCSGQLGVSITLSWSELWLCNLVFAGFFL